MKVPSSGKAESEIEGEMEVDVISKYVCVKRLSNKKKALQRAKVRTKRLKMAREEQEKQTKLRRMFMFLLCNSLLAMTMPVRVTWEYERSSEWWERVVNPTFTASDWLNNFRRSRITFLYLCNEITKKDTEMRPAISVEKRVALTLWFLATNADYRTIGHLFGVSKASVCVIRKQVCRAIVNVLLRKYIALPSGSALATVLNGFAQKGFPHCAGAVDGTHIPIEAPQDSPADYHNRKGWHSIILQGRFTDINVGWPGRVHNARVFHNSGLFSRGESGTLFPNNSMIINGTNVPVVIIGDPAYPLRPWLMKLYVNTGHLSSEKLVFNNRLSKARVVVEHTYGRLKGRWRCLRSKLAVQVIDVPELVGACCILHNICQLHQEGFDDEWMDQDGCSCDSPASLSSTTSTTHADRIRLAFTQYFKDH